MSNILDERPAPGGADARTEDALEQGIVVRGLTKTYKGGKVKALDSLDLEVRPGEAVGLVGPNGAGKTTLLSCLMGFLRYDKGLISIDGLAPDDLVTRASVGYLPERLTFDRWMTGRDFVNYHHELAGMPEKIRKKDCEELLTRVQLDSEAWSQPVRKYSRGMLQRLGFAQALVGKPRYLLLDEPASGMDPHGVLIVQGLLKSLRQEGLTILLNSHQLDQIERSCDRVVFIAGGKVVRQENLKEKDILREVILGLRWLTEPGVSSTENAEKFLSAEELQAAVVRLAAHGGGELIDLSLAEGRASVKVVNEDASATLIKKLVEAGVPLVQVGPERSRLERAFLEQVEQTNNWKGKEKGGKP